MKVSLTTKFEGPNISEKSQGGPEKGRHKVRLLNFFLAAPQVLAVY
jgi:hypothetical protein